MPDNEERRYHRGKYWTNILLKIFYQKNDFIRIWRNGHERIGFALEP